jgi:glyoxylate utilization-related uncharacterized protein
MKTKLVALLVVLAGLSSVALAKKPGSLLVPTGDIKWGDVPGMAGVQLAAVEGDPSKGPAHFFLKFAGGFAAPLHYHTADHFGTVVAGTLALTVDGKEQKLPPGSFFAFSGKTKHATRCEAGPDCVLSMDARGKWDVVPEADKAAAKK